MFGPDSCRNGTFERHWKLLENAAHSNAAGPLSQSPLYEYSREAELIGGLRARESQSDDWIRKTGRTSPCFGFSSGGTPSNITPHTGGCGQWLALVSGTLVWGRGGRRSFHQNPPQQMSRAKTRGLEYHEKRMMPDSSIDCTPRGPGRRMGAFVPWFFSRGDPDAPLPFPMPRVVIEGEKAMWNACGCGWKAQDPKQRVNWCRGGGCVDLRARIENHRSIGY